MKRLILLVFMILGIVTMAENLNTDGKDHLKELLGKWGEPAPIYLILEGKKLYFIDQEDSKNPVTKLNSYTYIINWQNDGTKSCFAFDTKKKVFTFLKCGTDEVNSYVPKKHTKMGG